MHLTRFASLEAVVVEPSAPDQTVVLLHGYGAPGTDLVGLGRELGLPRTRFVFLMAPLLLDAGSDPYRAPRAWWPIDMLELQTLRATGQFEKLVVQVPDGLADARAALEGALDAIVDAYGIVRERLVLGGFSQGAMLSADHAFRSDAPLGALVLLSGTYLCRDEWAPGLEARAGLPCFQSHSPDDAVLPYALATRLGAALDGAHLRRTFVEFRGGHGVSREVLAGLGDFLRDLPR